jgi:hypothetical protein
MTDDTKTVEEMYGEFTGNSKSKAKKRQIVELIASGATVQEVCTHFGISQNAYYLMRRTDPAFKKACEESADVSRMARGKFSEGRRLIFDPDRKMPKKPPFAEWRMKYLGRPTTPLGQAIADAMLDTTSRITFVHAPPGGGKDTTVCDTILYIKCDDRNYTRVAYINETEEFAKRRVSNRVAPYLTDPAVYQAPPHQTPGGRPPKGSLITDFGPFKWERGMRYPSGSPVEKTTWTQLTMRFLQSAAAPEAEPDLWATGMEGAIYGSRVQLMVFSDLFTVENQRTPSKRDSQFQWVTGTADSRLDGSGRLVLIHTRVGRHDNQGRLMSHYIGESAVYDSKTEGPITVTRHVNGVTTVTCQAIWVDENGDERSFDPERFPLDDHWKMPDGSLVPLDEMTRDEAQAQGAGPMSGLRSIRERDPDWFETAFQQNPQSSRELVDFTDTVLDRVSAPDRSYGLAHPREVRILAVDPAREGWAAWVLLGVNVDEERITVCDFRLHRKLGIEGIKRRLLADPIMLHAPQYLCYETNHESGVLYDPDIQQLIRDMGVTVIDHYTNKNRMDAEIGVARMAGTMMSGRGPWLPTMLPADKAKTLTVRQHFKNWDADPQSRRKQHRQKDTDPDDIAMAVWLGWLHATNLIDRAFRRSTAPAKRDVPAAVRRRWQTRSGAGTRASMRERARTSAVHDVDLLKLYLGEGQ